MTCKHNVELWDSCPLCRREEEPIVIDRIGQTWKKAVSFGRQEEILLETTSGAYIALYWIEVICSGPKDGQTQFTPVKQSEL